MRTTATRDARLARARAQVAPFALSYARFVRECRVHVASLTPDALRGLIADTDLVFASGGVFELTESSGAVADDATLHEFIAADMLGTEARHRLRSLEALPAPADVPVEGPVPTAIQGAWNDAGETP